MKIDIQKTNDLVTPALETYIEAKLMPLARFIKQFDAAGVAELVLEVSRTSKHHKKGEVYLAAADLRIPKKIFRAEEYADDIRIAIDRVRDTLRLEIEKHKTKALETRKKVAPAR